MNVVKKIKSIFNKNGHYLSFREGLDLTDVPVVTFSQGNKDLNFILDTGSGISIIHRPLLEKLNHTIDDSMVVDSIGIDGGSNRCNVCNMDIEYKKDVYTSKFVIRDIEDIIKAFKETCGVNVDGLLGSDFFDKYDYVLDFQQYIAYSKKKL